MSDLVDVFSFKVKRSLRHDNTILFCPALMWAQAVFPFAYTPTLGETFGPSGSLWRGKVENSVSSYKGPTLYTIHHLEQITGNNTDFYMCQIGLTLTYS